MSHVLSLRNWISTKCHHWKNLPAYFHSRWKYSSLQFGRDKPFLQEIVMHQYVLNQTNTMLIWIENAMKEFLVTQYLCSKGMNIFFQGCRNNLFTIILSSFIIHYPVGKNAFEIFFKVYSFSLFSSHFWEFFELHSLSTIFSSLSFYTDSRVKTFSLIKQSWQYFRRKWNQSKTLDCLAFFINILLNFIE